MKLSVTTDEIKIKAKDDKLYISYEEENGEVEPPVEPPDEAGIGCDTSVKSGTFDVSGYGAPKPQTPIVNLEQFGGRAGEDSTAALHSAWDAVKGKGTIELKGMYGLKGSNKFHDGRDASIIGQGRGTGFFSVDQPYPGSEWRALVEFQKPQNVVVDNCEWDGRDKKIGLIRYDNDQGLWLMRLHCHDVSGDQDGGRHIPLAMIKGSGVSRNFRGIGLFIEKGWGDAGATSGVRALWGAQDKEGCSGALIDHVWAEKTGHTAIIWSGGKGDLNKLHHVTSRHNGGAGMKTETPDAFKDDRGWLTWFPDEYTVEIRRSDFRQNNFHGIQFSGAGTDVEDCIFENNRLYAAASFDRNYRNRFVSNLMLDSKEGAIWCSSRDTRPFGELQFHENTMKGHLKSGGVGFHPRCVSPRGAIHITNNNIQAGKSTVTPTPEIEAHPGYREENNGPR